MLWIRLKTFRSYEVKAFRFAVTIDIPLLRRWDAPEPASGSAGVLMPQPAGEKLGVGCGQTAALCHLVTCRRRWDNQPRSMERLPEQLVSEFLNAHRESAAYLRDPIARLAELATAEDRDAAQAATKAIFASLVEPLADSFEPAGVSLYNRAFAQVIQFCRSKPRAEMLDRELRESGLASEQDLIARAEKLRRVINLTALRSRAGGIRRVVVLSRVTLGADVAITSVIIERMKHSFPEAEIVLVGGKKSEELFGGDPRARFSEISYRRTATMIERLLTWTSLLECIADVTRGLDPGEYLIADPDTRLTQLGLLPVTSTRESRADNVAAAETPEYVFFPSREYGSSTSQSLGELTSAWLDEVFGESVRTYPRVSLHREDLEAARNLVNKMKGDRRRPIVAINFGVGENPLKRVGGDFEESLAARLIQEGAGIVLDKGAGEEETARADALIAELTRVERGGRRVRVAEISEQSVTGALTSADADCDILVWSGRIGMLAALIGESDLYIGYDSAGAHIAAALGVPCIDVFAGFSSPRMLDRWRPAGKAETRIVAVDALNGVVGSGGLLETVLSHAVPMLRREN